MSPTLVNFKAVLGGANAVSLKTRLVRLVPFESLVLYRPPDWLYTSGRPNRYNPAGVDCIYFSETKSVADLEFESRFQGRQPGFQPVTRFYAGVSLERVLDLMDVRTLQLLGLNEKMLFRSWRLARKPTVTQLLGLAVSETRSFCALRYPSEPAARMKTVGANVVIFRHCIRRPDFVRILSADSNPLQEWP